jgi:hypothetical protein
MAYKYGKSGVEFIIVNLIRGSGSILLLVFAVILLRLANGKSNKGLFSHYNWVRMKSTGTRFHQTKYASFVASSATPSAPSLSIHHGSHQLLLLSSPGFTKSVPSTACPSLLMHFKTPDVITQPS